MKLILTILFFAIIQSSQAQDYKLNNIADGAVLSIGSIADFWVHTQFASNKNLTPQEIENLNKANIFLMDRFAADNYSKKLSKISDYLLILNASAPLALLFDDKLNGERFTYSIMYLENLMFASLFPGISKAAFDRYRPYLYREDVPFEIKNKSDSKSSFFSGHTTIAFASSVFMSTVYQELYPQSKYKEIVWISSLILAGSVGVLRIESGKHFPSDVLIGAAVGSLTGFIIPQFHKNTTKSELPQITNIPLIILKFKL